MRSFAQSILILSCLFLAACSSSEKREEELTEREYYNQAREAMDDNNFLQFCDTRGLKTLKGHRSVGGFRASIYNAMPKDGVNALIAAMKEYKV